MTANDTILIISPFDMWGLNTLSLHNAVEKDYYYDIICKTESDEINDTKSKLGILIELCSKCDPQNIYKKYGKDKFRKIEDFYIKGEQKIKGYIKQLSDKNVCEAIKLADELDIKVFYRQKNKEELLKKNILKLSESEIVPKMSFRKTDNGIDYTLKLTDGNSTIIPCRHYTKLISENPGALIIDTTIFMLTDNFSGKIISPFIEKESIFIPKHMQNEYFRKFILKNVYKSEISAEGFDVVEEHPEISCKLQLHTDIFNKSKINVSFSYGENINFSSDNPRDKYVSLEEDGNEGFRFVKIIRDTDFERHVMDKLVRELGMPTEYCSKYNLIEWLNEHTDALQKNKIDFAQENNHVYVIGKTEIRQTINRENDWFQLFIEIVLEDGTIIKFSEIKENLQKGEREVRLNDGRYFIIPEEWFAKYTGTAIFGRQKGDRIYIHRSQQNIINGNNICRTKINEVCTDNITLPIKLNAKLRNYQKEGYEWLFRNFQMHTGCCLSDDMGLGKTIQTIALILKYKEIGIKESVVHADCSPNLLFSNDEMQGQDKTCDNESQNGHIPYRTCVVISPASVVHNWKNELKRFAPSLNVMEYIGSQEERKKKREAIMTWDVVLTTYQTMRNDIEKLSKYKYGIIVFDEAQCFKNRNSQIYKSVLMLNSIQKEALSGTPMENSLNDLWSLMNVLNPMLLGDFNAFNRNYIAPITSNLQSEKTAILKKLIEPYFLKRTKEEVLPDLPSRQDETIVCEMQEEQKRLYEEELSKARNMIMSYKSAILEKNFMSSENECTSIHVLTAITRLRQIANHPMLVKEKDDVEHNIQKSARQTLCEGSGKMSEIFSRLENINGTCHKVLLFSESVSFLKIIAEEMKSRLWNFEMLTGETSNRELAIKRFNDSPSCQYFLISLKAGGVGLNLTTADYVFLLDPWWNRSAEEQAISRSHRIGQHNSVFVYKFISKNTLEEQIMNLQERKQTLIESVMPFIADTKKQTSI